MLSARSRPARIALGAEPARWKIWALFAVGGERALDGIDGDEIRFTADVDGLNHDGAHLCVGGDELVLPQGVLYRDCRELAGIASHGIVFEEVTDGKT